MLQRFRAAVLFLWGVLVLILKDVVLWLSPKRKTITDDIILITGGGRGIGRSLALQLAKYNPKHIILWGRTSSTLSETAHEVQEKGVNCAYMVCDVSSREQIYAMAKEVEAKFGQVTLLVNNAGVVFGHSVLDGDARLTELTLRTNTLAHFWTTRAFLPGMLEHNHGHIVVMSSMLGLSALNGAADYCSSKFATAGFAEALQNELKSSGVTGVKVTGIYPYQVDNTMFAGVTTRFPRIFPPINEDYLASKMIDAILTERSKLIVPKLMYFVVMFYSLAPVSAVIPIMSLTGVHKAMDQLHQHRRKSSSLSLSS